LRFFSPPENPSFTDRLMKLGVHLDKLHLLFGELEEVHRVDLVKAALCGVAS